MPQSKCAKRLPDFQVEATSMLQRVYSLLHSMYRVSVIHYVFQIVDYSGGRTLEDLIKYVEQQVSGKVGDDDDDTDSEDEGEGQEEEPEVPKDEL